MEYKSNPELEPIQEVEAGEEVEGNISVGNVEPNRGGGAVIINCKFCAGNTRYHKPDCTRDEYLRPDD